MRACSIVLVILVACGRADEGSLRGATTSGLPESAGASVVDAQPDSAPTAPHDSSAFRGGVDPIEAKGRVSGVVILNAVRTARHNGFDRIVFEFRGQELPDYLVEYAREAPTQCGSGAPVSVHGAAQLSVRLSPAQAHAPVGDEERSTLASRALNLRYPTVEAMTLSCDFEAVVGWVLDLSQRTPFRVTTLGAPARLILDVESR